MIYIVILLIAFLSHDLNNFKNLKTTSQFTFPLIQNQHIMQAFQLDNARVALLPAALSLSSWYNTHGKYPRKVYRVTLKNTPIMNPVFTETLFAHGQHTVLRAWTAEEGKVLLDGVVTVTAGGITEMSMWKAGSPLHVTWCLEDGKEVLRATFDEESCLHAEGDTPALILRSASGVDLVTAFSTHGVLQHPVENVPCRVIREEDGSSHMVSYCYRGKAHRSDGGPSFWRSDGIAFYKQHGELHRIGGPARQVLKQKPQYYVEGEFIGEAPVASL